jgi:hypothetical protein
MRTRRSSFGGLALLLVCALGGLACKQGVGGRCVQDSDCQSGICSGYGESSTFHCVAPASSVPMDSGATTSDDAADARSDMAVHDAKADDAKADDAKADDAKADDARADDAKKDAPESDVSSVADAAPKDLRSTDATADH